MHDFENEQTLLFHCIQVILNSYLQATPLKNQMTLPQLQKMADKQRQQILRNNQELIQKQQRLMEMQSGMRRGNLSSQASPKPNPNDKYAAKLRETYQNHLSRLRTLNNIKNETELQKFNNIEIGMSDAITSCFSLHKAVVFETRESK